MACKLYPCSMLSLVIAPSVRYSCTEVQNCLPVRMRVRTGRCSVCLTVALRRTGLHSDPDGTSVVFSPCAVAILLEVGQPAPERCLVKVWQQYTTVGATASVGERHLVNSIVVDPFRPGDHLAEAVFAPYPCALSRLPRLMFLDNTEVFKSQKKQSDTIRKKGLEAIPGIVAGLFSSLQAGGLAAGLAGPATIGVSLLGGSALLTSLALLTLNLGMTPAATLVALPSAAFQTWSFNQLSGNTISATMGAVATFGLALFDGVRTSLNTAATPPPKRVYITIEDFTNALNVIASTTSLSNSELKAAEREHTFRREYTILSWLMEAGEASGAGQAVFGYLSNVLNLDEFWDDANNAPERPNASIRTTIEVEIFDAWLSAGTEAVHRFEFASTRDDSFVFGYLASDLLGAIDRLGDAYDRFTQSIDQQVGATPTGIDQLNSWLDVHLFRQIYEV